MSLISSLRDAVELQLEDRVRLRLVERERLHQLLGGVLLAVAFADDLDGLVEAVEDDLEALEDVDPPFQLRQLELEPLPHGGKAEVEEVPQHLSERAAPWGQPAVLQRDQAGGVVGEVLLERGVLVEVGHHRFGVGARFQLEPQLAGRARRTDPERRRAAAVSASRGRRRGRSSAGRSRRRTGST